MEKYLSKIRPKHYGIVAFLLTCVTTYMMLSYEQVLSTGIYLFPEGDTINQFIPFVKMFVRDLTEGESLWYSWSTSMGQNTALTYSYYALNPFNLLYVVFPFWDEAVVTAMIFILKTGLAAYFFQHFSVKVLKCEGIESIVFSLFYALCSFNVIYNVLYIMWIDALYLLPFICQLIYQLYKERKWKCLVFSYSFLFITQFYMAYIVGVFTFLFMFLILVLYVDRFIDRFNKIKFICKYFAAVVLAVGLSGIVWMPTLIYLYRNNMQSVMEFDTLKADIPDIIYNLSWGQMQGVEGIYPYIYCGIPTIILCVLYFLNKKIKVKEKILASILGVFLFASMLVLPLYKFMHAFDAPDKIGYRFAFLLSFLMCAIACRQSAFLKDISTKVFTYVISAIFILYIILFIMQENIALNIEPVVWVPIVGNILFLVLWITFFVFGLKKIKNQTMCAMLVLFIACVEVISNGYATYMVMGPEGTERHYNTYKNSIETGVALIEDEDFYRVRYNNDYIVNSDSWFDYKGISDFCTARNIVLQKTMSSLGHYSCRNTISDIGNTPVTDMLFGIKYIINGVHPYMLATQMPDPTVIENSTALALGYMVDEEVLVYQIPSSHVFDNMDMLLQSMTGEDINCFENVPADSLVMTTENAWYETVEGGIRIGRNTDNEEDAYIYYHIPACEEKAAYVQFQNEKSEITPNAPVLLGGEENSVTENGYITVSYARKLDENQGALGITVLICPDDMAWVTYQQANFSYYNGAELAKAYDILSQNQMEIEEYGNAYIDANITVPEERTVLFTSIPYDSGWTVYVDGVESETKAVVGDAFLALELEPGYHDLEFRYEAPGARAGMAVSGISLGIYGILIVADLVKSKKRKAKEGNVKPDVEDRTE